MYSMHHSALCFLFSASFMVCSVYAGINDEWSDEEFIWDWEEEELAVVQEAPRSAERPRVTQLDAEEKEIRKYRAPQAKEPEIAPRKEKSLSAREEYRKKRAERMKAAKAEKPAKKSR